MAGRVTEHLHRESKLVKRKKFRLERRGRGRAGTNKQSSRHPRHRRRCRPRQIVGRKIVRARANTRPCIMERINVADVCNIPYPVLRHNRRTTVVARYAHLASRTSTVDVLLGRHFRKFLYGGQNVIKLPDYIAGTRGRE